jgi:hypothetical protein
MGARARCETAALADHVDAWRGGHLGPHELSDHIHEFHNGAARELFGLYTHVHPSQLVARAVANGLLSETEVPAALLTKLSRSIEFYRAERAAPVTDDPDSEDE